MALPGADEIGGEHWRAGLPERTPHALQAPVCDTERETMIAWALQRIPHLTRLDHDKAYPLAVYRRDSGDDPANIVAVALYHELRGCTVELSMAATTPRWATRDTVSAILLWPFTILRVRRITTITPSRNTRALRLNHGLGFEREGVMRDAFPDDDAVICGLTANDWLASRWCRGEEC